MSSKQAADKLLEQATLVDLERQLLVSPLQFGEIKKAIKALYQTIDQAFALDCDILALLNARAKLVDHVLSTLWQRFPWPATDSVALIAVGGYGRGELHPQSDVDLLLLSQKTLTETTKTHISEFITMLWDIGLEIGHSVRSLKDTIKLSKEDITVATNLMEARYLTGSEALFKQLKIKANKKKIWPSKKFFQAKWEEQVKRHDKYNNTAYNLEPNIKQNPGGLRDIQTIQWVTQRQFGVQDLYSLVEKNFLTQTEYQSIKDAQHYLWKLRYALHLVSNRSEDRLLFDYQKQLAEYLGYQDTSQRLGVESMMMQYYRAVMVLSELNDMLLHYFQETLVATRYRRKKKLSDNFVSINHYIAVNQDSCFKENPSLLLELFVTMAQHPQIKGVRASTIRLIREHRHLIDQNFRDNPANQALFMALLRSPSGLFDTLHRMKRYGILGMYIPELADVTGQMQFDLFHAFTVDEHTLFVVRNIERFKDDEAALTFPVCAQIIKTIEHPEWLYIAALFHDIAKGRGGDHSELGMQDAENFCQRHGLSTYETRLIAWLVQNHLVLSMTAQKQDLGDPEVINQFASFVRDRTHLDYLYLLTVADICGTNLTLWNGWRSTLMRQLYDMTCSALSQGLEHQMNKRQLVKETKLDALALLENKGLQLKQVMAVWLEQKEGYFLRHSASDIAWQTEAIIKHKTPNQPLVALRKHPRHDGTEVFIRCPDRPFLFAAMTNVFYQLGLSVVSARLMTDHEAYAMDTYYILDRTGQSLDDNERIEEIYDGLVEQLQDPDRCVVKHFRKPPRRVRQFDLSTEVTFKEDSKNNRTIMEIVSLDQPGLLARIANVFFDHKILLQTANITTIGERAEDTLFITDSNHQPLKDDQQKDSLRQAICEVLDH